ncbi:hypothetical protein COT72_05160 [archaeon CG10_big_fil_rev_8_21_14_0_10_43_11]|nr:MAG: hypothetical protein COT72_05160 [archaeon CG10_big_fil_rev_8_21_14_0_10_43_11]
MQNITLFDSVYIVDNQDKRTNPEHEKTRETVLAWLRAHAKKVMQLQNKELGTGVFDDATMVITVGGDGTLLGAAHYIQNNAVVLGIRSTSTSIGHVCSANLDTIESSLKKLEQGEFEIAALSRINAIITANGNTFTCSHPALNEISFANKSTPRRMVYYELETNEFKEFQAGDTLIFSTGTGSTAYIKDLIEREKYDAYSGESDTLLFGLYARCLGKKRFGEIKDGFAKVTVKTDEGAYLAIDSQKTYFLQIGDSFTLAPAPKLRTLHFITNNC